MPTEKIAVGPRDQASYLIEVRYMDLGFYFNQVDLDLTSLYLIDEEEYAMTSAARCRGRRRWWWRKTVVISTATCLRGIRPVNS
jgi:hypothetical protein